jgi:hypothetical protein
LRLEIPSHLAFFPLPADNCNQLGEKFLALGSGILLFLCVQVFGGKNLNERLVGERRPHKWHGVSSSKLLFINFSALAPAASRGAAASTACNSQTHKTQLSGLVIKTKQIKCCSLFGSPRALLSPCTDLNDFLV